MNPADSKIEATRELIAEKLRNASWLDGVSVLTQRTGNIVAQFTQDIGNLGLAVVVGVISVREGGSQSARVDWRPAKFFVDICEYVAVRQIPGEEKPGAWAYAEAVVAELKLCSIRETIFPQISDQDIAEVEPPKEWAHLLIVRVPLEMDFCGTTRDTTD